MVHLASSMKNHSKSQSTSLALLNSGRQIGLKRGIAILTSQASSEFLIWKTTWQGTIRQGSRCPQAPVLSVQLASCKSRRVPYSFLHIPPSIPYWPSRDTRKAGISYYRLVTCSVSSTHCMSCLNNTFLII